MLHIDGFTQNVYIFTIRVNHTYWVAKSGHYYITPMVKGTMLHLSSLSRTKIADKMTFGAVNEAFTDRWQSLYHGKAKVSQQYIHTNT